MDYISTDKAPAAVGPYSQAIRTGNMVFLSGQIPLIPETGDIAGSDISTQTKQALKNMDTVLTASGTCKENVLKTTVFLTDLADFEQFNLIYADFFGSHKPARSTVQVVKLPKGVKIEIDSIAYVEGKTT